MDYPGIHKLGEHTRQKLWAQADLELAKRSIAGCLFPFLLLLIIGALTPYWHDRPMVILAAGTALLTIGVARAGIAWVIISGMGRNWPLWRVLFRVGTYATAIAWSVFSCESLEIYRHRGTAWLVLVVTTGIASGAVTSLTPDLLLSSGYAIILLAPVAFLGTFLDTAGGYATATVVVLYLVFLLILGRQQRRFYWDSVRASALLEERGTYLKALTEESPLAMAVVDTQHRLQMCNRAFERLFLFEQAELAGQKLSEIFHAAPSEVEKFTRLAETGKPVHTVHRRARKDGKELYVEIHAVPLILDGKIQGLLILYQDITDRTIAEEKLQRRSEEINLLREMAQMLQACRETSEAYTIVRETAQRLLPDQAGSLSIMNSSGNVLETVAVWGEGISCDRVFMLDDCWSLRRGQPHRFITDGKNSSARCRHNIDAEISESLCIPLLGEKEVLGVLHLQTRAMKPNVLGEDAETHREAQQRLGTMLGEQVARSLASLRMQERLRIQSVRDPLTGLFNRRYMEESLEREASRAIRNESSVALVLVDIDYFKRFNDTFGHVAGDALLRAVGDFLIRNTRGQDVACRYGGEEFALLLCGASLEAATARAEILRQEIKELNVRHGGQQLGAVTLSIGVVAFPLHTRTPDELISLADKALYRAKQEGRDRTVAFSSALEKSAAGEAG